MFSPLNYLTSMKIQSHRNHLYEVTQVTSLKPGLAPKAIFFSFYLIASLKPYGKKHNCPLSPPPRFSPLDPYFFILPPSGPCIK